MKQILRISLLAACLLPGFKLQAQFFKSEHENVLIYQDDEILFKNFPYYPFAFGRDFHYLNDQYIAITSPINSIYKNDVALSIYENFQYKKTYSFLYSTKTKVLAFNNDELFIPIEKTDDSYNVLCRLNLKTQAISYIQLPTNLRYLPYEEYFLHDFTFDKATSMAYLFVQTKDKGKERYIIPYNLKTNQFSEKIPHNFDENIFTLNSYHYFKDKSNNLYSINLGVTNAKPNKIFGPSYLNPIQISETEVLFFYKLKGDDREYKPKSDQSEFIVAKNGDLVKDVENGYRDIFNTIRNKLEDNVFYFNYSDSDGYKDKVILETEKLYNDWGFTARIVKPGFFIMPTKAIGHPYGVDWSNINEQNTPVVNSNPTPASTTPADEFDERVVSFFNANGSSKHITLDSNSWYGKCLEFEKCQKETANAYFDCKDLKAAIQSLGLNSQLNECEYLLNTLTGSRKEHYKITWGLTNYENVKNELIYIKSLIIRVQAY